MYRDARKACGMSIEHASFSLNVAPRTLSIYEADERVPPPEVVLEMSKVYKDPSMTKCYCREQCAIGAAYSYAVLNNISLDPTSVAVKLLEEMNEANPILIPFVTSLVNKKTLSDFTQRERELFRDNLLQLMDVQRTMEILLICLGHWMDTSELVALHDQKCRDRGYIKKETAHLRAAQ